MRKFVTILVVLILVVGNGFAQKKRVLNLPNYDKKILHFGFYLGSGTMDWNVSHAQEANYRTDIVKLQPSFTVGVVSNYRLKKNLDLRFLPGMSLSGNRTLDFYEYSGDVAEGEPKATFNIKTTYIEFPLLLKYKSNRVNNQRPYLIGGLNYRMDISDVVEKELDDEVAHIPFKKSGFYVEFGVGLDTYLQYFRLSSEFKVSLGLNNMLDNGYTFEEGIDRTYSDVLDKLTSNIFQLTFYFE